MFDTARMLGELVQVLSGLGGACQQPAPHSHSHNHNHDDALLCARPHPLSVVELAERLGETMHCPRSVFVVAAALCNRLFTHQPSAFSPRTAHKLVLASAVVGCKAVCDVVCPNAFYAEDCALVACGELRAAEARFLALLDFRVFVSPAEYNDTAEWLCEEFPEEDDEDDEDDEEEGDSEGEEDNTGTPDEDEEDEDGVVLASPCSSRKRALREAKAADAPAPPSKRSRCSLVSLTATSHHHHHRALGVAC